MNVIHHRVYTLECDVWEATQKQAQAEIDQVVLAIKAQLSHCGHVKLTLTSEARQS